MDPSPAPSRPTGLLAPLLLLLAACGEGAPGAGAEESAAADAEPRRPNVLVVVSDQMRADVLGAYGSPWGVETPNLDRLAAEGTVFDRALSTYPLCTPWRGMFLTGRAPTHSGIVLNSIDASPVQNPNCLADVFAAGGWDTAFIGKWHLAAGVRKEIGLTERVRGAAEGYLEENPEPEFVPPGPARLGFEHWEAYNYHHDFQDPWWYRDTPERITADGFEVDVLTDRALAYMREKEEQGEPYLLVLSLHPPHPPFKKDVLPEPGLEGIPEDFDWPPNVPPNASRRRFPIEVRCYLAMCRNVDENVGRLLEHLDGPAGEDTIVVFTSDHGEMHGAHGLQNKMAPYTESVKVPLIVRWPGHVPAGRRTDVLQTPMDHLPTLASLAGLPIPAEVDGVDLGPHLLGGPAPERDAVLMMNMTSHFSLFRTGGAFPEWRAVRTPRYTYVRWIDGREALFDDVRDPYQLVDLAATGTAPQELERLRGRLAELLEEADDEFLPGSAYAAWYDDERNLVRTALGPVR